MLYTYAETKKLLGSNGDLFFFFFNFPRNLKVDCQDIERGDRNYTPELNVWRVLL